MQLTLTNYFTPENNYLTNSKIGDWLKSKEYFFRKHIIHDIQQEHKAYYDTGSAVDDLLTMVENRSKYVVVSRRNLKNPPEGVIELLPQQYDEIMGLACAVDATDAYKEIKHHNKQTVLQYDIPIGEHFVGLAGIPDFFTIENRKAIITDLKTSQTIDTRRYGYHCEEYGYYRQAAFYLYLLMLTRQADFDDFECRHLVVEKQKNIWNVETFRFDNDRIEREIESIKWTIKDIAAEQDFKKHNPTFATSIILGETEEMDVEII